MLGVEISEDPPKEPLGSGWGTGLTSLKIYIPPKQHIPCPPGEKSLQA